MADRWSVFWSGEVVGYMHSPTVDMFEYYGTWEAVATRKADEFLKLLEQGEDAEVEISSGSSKRKLAGYVPYPPDEEISVKLRASNFE